MLARYEPPGTSRASVGDVMAVSWIAIALLASSSGTPPRITSVVACKFRSLPPMRLVFRGSSEDHASTVQIGREKPVPLAEGSGMSTAEYGLQELTFSLRLPASVTISAPGNDTLTYGGECHSVSR